MPVLAIDGSEVDEMLPAEEIVELIKERGDLEVAGTSLASFEDVPMQAS